MTKKKHKFYTEEWPGQSMEEYFLGADPRKHKDYLYSGGQKKKRRSLTVRKGFKEDRGEDFPNIRTIKIKKKQFKISKTYFSKWGKKDNGYKKNS